VQIALYIVLGALVVVAVAMQVWMMRAGGALIPAERRGLALFLRSLNIVLLLAAIGLVIYVTAWR
jgi:hypothetical protein